MNSRCLLALLVLGCSSSSHPTNRTTINTGKGNDISDSGTYTGDNSSCPAWPKEKLFPSVGVFFYGPDKGPCSGTITDRSGVSPKSYTVFYTYDADDKPIQARTGKDAAGNNILPVYQFDYTYSQGVLSKEKDFSAGLPSDYAYSYTDNIATYLLTNSKFEIYQYDFALDANGYPQSVNIGLYVEGKLTTITAGASKFVFRYEDCRIQERSAFTAGGEPVAENTSTYYYDQVGHLVDISSENMEYSYDYSCWLPPDAGTGDAG